MSNRKKLECAKRRAQVADLSLKGWTQTAIAEHLHVSQATVSQDLRRCEQELRGAAIHDMDLLRSKELGRLEQIHREAWAGWERSQKPAQSADIAGDGPGAPTRKRIRNQHGDPRYLEVLIKCHMRKCALLGLDAPTKVAAATLALSQERQETSPLGSASPAQPEPDEVWDDFVKEATPEELEAAFKLHQGYQRILNRRKQSLEDDELE